MKPSHDYAELDKFRYHFRAERLQIARSAGYPYISQHIIETYRKTRSQRVTGRICGGISGEAVGQFLIRCGEPRNGKGGANKGPSIMVDVNGYEMSIGDIARKTGLSYNIIHKRVYRGWPVERIMQKRRFRRVKEAAVRL